MVRARLGLGAPSVKKKLQVGPEIVSNQASNDLPGHWPGENHEWDLDYFKDNFNVKFHTHSPHDTSFSLTGIDTSVANAFRRILLAEIPTLAIEDVFIYQNTSIIQDEVLAHRLGLIPLCGSHKGLRWLKWYKKETDDDEGSGTPSDYNTVIMKLDVECSWQEGGLQRAVQGETDPDKLYIGHNVYAKDLVWEPLGKQFDEFPSGEEIRATNPDILIVKMRPGQKIQLSMHAIKGIGQDHAKFSPVATASYRLMPTIDILKPIVGADAKKFARCFPRGVIKLETVTSEDVEKNTELAGQEGESKAVVDDPMKDTVSRECLRHPEFKDKVNLGRIRDHFIFRVESTGQWESDELFLESVKLLKVKCQRIKRGLDELTK
ncbi:DNA-directed RNA polymerases I and III subunit RPAC1 [Parastagonospora nodorum]|nr:DNA-directed RNA polymerases I and III subunit RPAC1 [Parastagonospora nodorum]KAH4056936.1 DNA-directed RNA polymerases I and III subunit RPAC1 [Parastagonospora nodorum]KAH4162996.1 DNA-directed RNA polymerases I and III subunit RPAC1 [Parastagonospora nodorum]KAH4197403.1 DNA-directed RNA polymerases I and III subunit RPAC1 [Parastagonospora nodorum]KAH4200827.1 DNA-directed RNA polymerases I and III subunit RPAC1 [Parastagonospora nodorum]